MIEKIYKYIQQHQMLEETGTVIAGLSGGADSVCLVAVLSEIIKKEHLDIELIAVHINHGIRGEEAKRDEEFAEKVCKDFGIRYISRHADIPLMARTERLSEEEAGRMVRYGVFAELADNVEKSTKRGVKIAVAHHQNDQAETVLMNIVRGSGLRGICGIRPVRDRIIRPLLCVSRLEIEKYLSKRSIAYVNDSTNEQLVYTRNKIRKELIPYVENNLNPNVVRKLSELADSAAEAQMYVQQQADKLYVQAVCTDVQSGSVILEIKKIEKEPEILQNYVVQKMIEQMAGAAKDVYKTHIKAVCMLMNMQVGKSVSLPYGLIAVKGYDAVSILHRDIYLKDNFKENDCMGLCESDCVYEVRPDESILEQVWQGKKYVLPLIQPVYIPQNKKNENIYVVMEQGENAEIYGNNDYTKLFDYDKIKGALSFRFRKTGDFMLIDKKGTPKSLKKELIDKKVPKEVRKDVLLLANQDEVLWAVGVRRSTAGLVTDTAKRILKISVVVQEDKINGTAPYQCTDIRGRN